MAKLSLVVADDNHVFLQKLIALLEVEFEILASATDGSAALDLIRRHKPDVAVLDLSMPNLNGIQVAEELAQLSPRPRVVICSIDTAPDLIDAARKVGASAHVFKARAAKDLVPAIKTAAEGSWFASSDEPLIATPNKPAV